MKQMRLLFRGYIFFMSLHKFIEMSPAYGGSVI